MSKVKKVFRKAKKEVERTFGSTGAKLVAPGTITASEIERFSGSIDRDLERFGGSVGEIVETFGSSVGGELERFGGDISDELQRAGRSTDVEFRRFARRVDDKLDPIKAALFPKESPAVAAPAPTPAAAPAEVPAVEKKVKEEQEALRRRRGIGSTVLTSPSGILSGQSGSIKRPSLLSK